MKNLLKIILLTFFVVNASAQVKKDSIFSKILNENVALSIYLPNNYNATAGKKFPVIYLLDSDINLGYFAPMMEFQNRALKDKGQNYVVVGIETKNRTKNFTPTKSSAPNPKDKTQTLFADSGGAEKFAEFLQKELKPRINLNYKTEDFSVLDGHSFGGLLALNILLKHPDYFQGYIINDPSFWWDHSYILKLFETAKPNFGSGKPFVFSSKAGLPDGGPSFGSGEPEGLPIFKQFLERNNIPYKSVSYPEETHGTEAYKANFDALRALNAFRNSK